MYLDEGHRNRSALVSRIRHECDLFRNLFRRSSSRLMRTLLALLASSGLVGASGFTAVQPPALSPPKNGSKRFNPNDRVQWSRNPLPLGVGISQECMGS